MKSKTIRHITRTGNILEWTPPTREQAHQLASDLKAYFHTNEAILATRLLQRIMLRQRKDVEKWAEADRKIMAYHQQLETIARRISPILNGIVVGKEPNHAKPSKKKK